MQEKDKLQTGGGDAPSSKGSSGKGRASYETMDLSMISSVINDVAEDIMKEEEEAAQKAAAAAKAAAQAEAAELEHYSMAVEQIVASVEAETTGASVSEAAGKPNAGAQDSGTEPDGTGDPRTKEASESNRTGEQAAGRAEPEDMLKTAAATAEGPQEAGSVDSPEVVLGGARADTAGGEAPDKEVPFFGQESGSNADQMTAQDGQRAAEYMPMEEETAAAQTVREKGPETVADAQADAAIARMAAAEDEAPETNADAQADAEIVRMTAAEDNGPEAVADAQADAEIARMAAAEDEAPETTADAQADAEIARMAAAAGEGSDAQEDQVPSSSVSGADHTAEKAAAAASAKTPDSDAEQKKKKREKRQLTPEQRKKRRRRRLLFLAAVVVVLLILLFAAALYYKKHWYPNTVINGQDYSGMTIEESEEDLKALVSSYELTILGRNGGSDVITAEEISLEADVAEVLEELFETQHASFFLAALFGSADESVEYNLSYDADALYDELAASVLVTGSDSYAITEPVSASISWSEEEGQAVICEADFGNVLVVETTAAYLEAAVESLETEVDLSDDETYPDAYEQPEYTSASTEVQQAQLTWNSYVLHWIVWDMGEDTTEELTPSEISQWVSMSEDYEVTLDTDALGDWLEELCLKYKTYGTTRNFTTHSGEVIQISGGDYGWRLDYDEIVEQAKEILQAEADETLITAYLDDSSEENQEALTSYVEPEWSNTAYQKDYTYFMYDWDPLNYSEVDISEQMVYVYQNGSLVYSCKCVTGLPQDGRDTDTGVWYIKDKKLEYTLTGDDYVTPTKYWVRITWTGIGYHYMARSDWSSWSPTLYLTAGSHGCVNLQLADAEAVYSYVSLYDAVFIHE